MLYNLLNGLVKVSPKNDVRYYLNTVHIKSNEYGDITLEATDGCAGIRFKTKADSVKGLDINEGVDVLLCRTSLGNVLKMFNTKSDMKLKVTKDSATLNDFPITIVDGRYPDLGRIIDGKHGYSTEDVGVNPVLLSKLMTNIHICLNKPKKPTVRIKVQGCTTPIYLVGDTECGVLEAVLMPVRL